MKRVDLIRAIEGLGCILPRHREVKEPLARRIIRMLANPDKGGTDPVVPGDA